MTSILRIDASIKAETSVSRKLTSRVIGRLLDAHPGATLVARDLGITNVTPIDGNWLGAVYTPAEARTEAQAIIAAEADTLLNEVKAADILVIGLPIYNFGIPAQLKNWIDQLARRGETFVYTEAGPQGLLTGKRAIVALSSDGTGLGSPIDFASGYVRHMLGFFGITDVEFVAADKMIFGAEDSIARAEAAVDALAA